LIGQVAKPGGRPPAIDLYRSVMMVVCLMRKNGTQEFPGAVFGVSQSTVGRRWDLLRPVILRAVASFIPYARGTRCRDRAGRRHDHVQDPGCDRTRHRPLQDLADDQRGREAVTVR
jgi:hypothetical protein